MFEETPGEDPVRLLSYVKSLIKGLQSGQDPKIKRIVATCKVSAVISSWPHSLFPAIFFSMPQFPHFSAKQNLIALQHIVSYDLETWNGNLPYQFNAQVTTQSLKAYYLHSKRLLVTPILAQSCKVPNNLSATMSIVLSLNVSQVLIQRFERCPYLHGQVSAPNHSARLLGADR